MNDDKKPYFVGPDTPLEISDNVRYVNEMRWQRDALLCVARAGRLFWETVDAIPGQEDLSQQGHGLVFYEALKEVEDLLD